MHTRFSYSMRETVNVSEADAKADCSAEGGATALPAASADFVDILGCCESSE